MEWVLLVTWFAYGSPPQSYQAEFKTMAACQIARQELVIERETMKQREDARLAQIPKQFGTIPAQRPVPELTAVCVSRGDLK